MDDGDDEDGVFLDTMDQPVAVDKALPDVFIAEFGDDSPSVWKVV